MAEDRLKEANEDELLAVMLELETASQERPTGAYRVEELHEQTGRNHTWVRRRLRKLMDAGRVERVVVKMETIAGTLTTVPAYRVIRKQEVET